MSGASASPAADARVRDAAVYVLRRLRAAGYETFFAGGSVRDLLLGGTPKDYDVATSATPDVVQRLFPKVIPVGVQFGVCRVRHSSVEIEVATFRTEQGYADGRHPDAVQFTGPQEDVQRRDFTVNGLLYDPETGEVLDYVGGRDDLTRRVIRAIGDPVERIREDRLRMLRAIRFAARLGFRIDDATLAAVRQFAPEIRRVSAERVRDELQKTLLEGGAAVGLDGLLASELLPHVLPEVAHLAEVAVPAAEGGTALASTRALLAALRPGVDEALAWAALLHRVASDEVRVVGERLRLPRRTIEVVAASVADLPTLPEAPEWTSSRLKRLLRSAHAGTLLALHVLHGVALAGAPSPSAEWLLERRAALGEDALRPAPLLTGHDLAALGYPKGPRYKAMLAALETAQLDGLLRDADEARAFLLREFGAP